MGRVSPTKFDRFMVAIHIGTNRKLRRLTPPERWCFVAGVLSIAAQASIPGCLVVGGGVDAEARDYAEQSGVTLAVATSTLRKLRDLAVIEYDQELGCETVRGWGEYQVQPRRPDPTNTDRQRRWRDKHRNGEVTHPNNGRANGTEEKGNETKRNEDTHTHLHAVCVQESG